MTNAELLNAVRVTLQAAWLRGMAHAPLRVQTVAALAPTKLVLVDLGPATVSCAIDAEPDRDVPLIPIWHEPASPAIVEVVSRFVTAGLDQLSTAAGQRAVALVDAGRACVRVGLDLDAARLNCVLVPTDPADDPIELFALAARGDDDAAVQLNVVH